MTPLTLAILIAITPTYQPPRAVELLYIKAYALNQVGPQQAPCLDALWTKESNWRWWASNKTSTAHGIAQLLGTPRHLTPYQQVDRGLTYIAHRYPTGGACEAWGHHRARGWY